MAGSPFTSKRVRGVTARLLVTPEQLRSDELISVSGDDYRHLFRSLRLRVHDILEVSDGAGAMRAGVVVQIDKRCAALRLDARLEPPQVATQLAIWTCTPRSERAAWLVEKCTELGVREFVFYAAERTARPMTDSGLDRLARVAKSALLQCGGAWMPRFDAVPSFESACQALGDLSEVLPVFVLEPEAPRTLLEAVVAVPDRAVLVLGPEGGLTPAEVEALERCGGQAVALGGSLLRMETAAVAASALLLARS